MNLRLRAALPLSLSLLLLAACAQNAPKDQPPENAIAATEADDSDNAELAPPAAAATLPEAGLHRAMTARRDRLRNLLKAQAARGDVAEIELDDDALRSTWRSAAMFAAGSAELQPQALDGLSRIAKWQRADGAIVLQVVGQLQRADPQDLAERRVAAVTAFLIAEGAPPARVRAQVVDLRQLPAARRDQDATIALVGVPIVEGRVARAWIPPALD